MRGLDHGAPDLMTMTLIMGLLERRLHVGQLWKDVACDADDARDRAMLILGTCIDQELAPSPPSVHQPQSTATLKS